MPTYEYACKSCGERLEVTQSFSDPALTECPACGGELRKVFHPIGVAFKGSGFYKTDSRPSSPAAKKETASTSSGDSSSNGSTTPAKSEAATSSSTKSDTPAAT